MEEGGGRTRETTLDFVCPHFPALAHPNSHTKWQYLAPRLYRLFTSMQEFFSFLWHRQRPHESEIPHADFILKLSFYRWHQNGARFSALKGNSEGGDDILLQDIL